MPHAPNTIRLAGALALGLMFFFAPGHAKLRPAVGFFRRCRRVDDPHQYGATHFKPRPAIPLELQCPIGRHRLRRQQAKPRRAGDAG